MCFLSAFINTIILTLIPIRCIYIAVFISLICLQFLTLPRLQIMKEQRLIFLLHFMKENTNLVNTRTQRIYFMASHDFYFTTSHLKKHTEKYKCKYTAFTYILLHHIPFHSITLTCRSSLQKRKQQHKQMITSQFVLVGSSVDLKRRLIFVIFQYLY